MKKFWNQKLERALAFVLSVLLVVNSIPLAGVSIAATNESEESNETPRSVSVIYGTEKWENLVAGIPLTPEMFGVDLTAASKEEDETVETTTADETSEAAEPVAGDESDDESSATDTTSSADDQGATETTSSADDQGATETTSSADDQGATDTTSSADDQGATETTSSADDQGATETTSSADDQGATETTSSADGQSVVVAPKYADAQSAGENGNNQTSGTSGETGGESSSSATEETSSDATEDQSEEAEEADVYSYFEVSQGVKEDGTPILSGLIELSGDNNEYLKVLSGENKVGTAVIGIQKNGDTIEGCTYTVSVAWADLPDNLVFEDVNGIFKPKDIYNVEFKNWLIISAEGWEASEKNLYTWREVADWTYNKAYNNDSRDVYFRYIEDGDLKGGIAKYTITVNSTYDVSQPNVAFYSIDGKITADYGKLYCFEETEGKVVNAVLTVQDGNFNIADGHTSHVSFYYDKFDEKNPTTNLLESTFKEQVETDWSVYGYSYDVLLPAENHGEHSLIAVVYDDYTNWTAQKLEDKAFQFISLSITYDLEGKERKKEFAEGDPVTIVNDMPRIRCWIEGSADKFTSVKGELGFRYWMGTTSTTYGFGERKQGNGEYQYFYDYDYPQNFNRWFDLDNNYFLLTCEDDFGHVFEKKVIFTTDATNPTLDFSVEPKTSDDKFVEKDGILYTGNADAVFTLDDEHIDETVVKIIQSKIGTGDDGKPIANGWGPSGTPNQWTVDYDLSALEEGKYSFAVSGYDKAGNKLRVKEATEYDQRFAKQVTDEAITIKDLVIDRTGPEISCDFIDKKENNKEDKYSTDKERYFNKTVTLRITVKDKYSPIEIVNYYFNAQESRLSGMGKILPSKETPCFVDSDGYWTLIADIEVPKELTDDSQPNGTFTIEAKDILGNEADAKNTDKVVWDTIKPVLKVESGEDYNSFPEGKNSDDDETGETEEDPVPIAYCKSPVLTDTLRILITDKDFDAKRLTILIDGVKLNVVQKTDGETETETETEAETETSASENTEDTSAEKVYYAVEEKVSGVGTGTWVIDGVEILAGDNDVPIKIRYEDPAENLIIAAEDDKFSRVCLDGYLSYSTSNPKIEIVSWDTPKAPDKTEEYGYHIIGGKVKHSVKITGHNVKGKTIKATLISDPKNAESKKTNKLSWNTNLTNYKHESGTGIRTFDLEYDCPDGPYMIKIECEDDHDYGGLLEYYILADSSAPEMVKPEYASNGKELDGVWYYNDTAKVTIGAEDGTTKIDKLFYELRDANGNVIQKAQEIESPEFSGDKSVKAVINLPETGDGAFDGMIRYWATNEYALGEKAENAITTQRIVVDRIAPKFSYQLDPAPVIDEDSDALFYPDTNVRLKLTIKETNFNKEDVFVRVNGEIYDAHWNSDGNGSDVWKSEVLLPKEGEFDVSVAYEDRSGHPMIVDDEEMANKATYGSMKNGEFKFSTIAIDTHHPELKVTVESEKTYDGLDEIAYFSDDVTICILVTEKYFTPRHVRVTISAVDADGKKVNYGKESAQEYVDSVVLSGSNWEHDKEKNQHTLRIPVKNEGRYTVSVRCSDFAAHETVSWFAQKGLKNNGRDYLQFVVDKSDPEITSITYAGEKDATPDDDENTMYYQQPVEVEVATRDNISGIRGFKYEFTPFDEGTKKESGTVTNKAFGTDGAGSTFSAKITLPEGSLDSDKQLNGYLVITAINGSELTADSKKGKRLVVDNIAPEMVGDMQYSPAHTTKDKKYYFQDTVTCLAQILEANFIASDVVLTINGKTEAQTADGWKKDAKNKNLYRHEFNLPTEGDYDITMTYTDRSGNKMKDFVSPTLVVDKTDPVITAEVSAAGAVNEEGGIRYYSSNQSLIVTVREHNFDPDAVKVNVTAFGVDGRTVLTEEHKPTVWSDLGNDIHQTIITLSTDGIYEVSASCADLSGRPSAVFKMNKIAIDKTAPAGLNITYSAPVREASIGGVAYQYYNGPVNVVVSANDDISGVSAFEYRFVRADGTSGVNVSIDTITIGQGQISYGNGNTAATYSFVLPGATLTANGQLNGTLEVRAINRSSLSSEVKDTKRIVADNLAPTLDVTYNDHVKEFDGIWYFNQAISASFSIGEANFYQEDFGFRVTKDGRDIASEIAWSNRPNDKHFGDFALSADGRYEVSMNYADRSGNAAPNYKSKAMIVDTVAPKVTITGISNQMASRDDTIGFVITIEDENLNLDEVTVLLQGVIVNEKGETSRINLSKEVEAQASQDGKSMTVVVTNLEKDAVYTVSCTALDKANNVTDTMVAENGKSYKKMVFSVNRNGSTYLLSEETEKFIGGFSKEPSDIVVTEINPTELKNIKVTLFKNDQTIELVEGTDYQVKKTGSIDTWYQYVYTVDKDVLRDDGVYRMAFYSEDRAGNVSNNTLDNKNVEISFAVDKTIPNVIITNLEEGVTYPVESLTVNIQASDNLKLVRGVAYLDGKECKTWDEQALSAASTGSSALSLDIKDDSVKARTLRVVVTDAAGNETEKVVSGFFVTTNLWIRYVNNKPLLFTSIGAVGVGSPSVAFLFRRRRRRFR